MPIITRASASRITLVSIAALALAVGCDTSLDRTRVAPGADGGGGALDAGRTPPGLDGGRPTGDFDAGDPIGSGASRTDICGNMFDDDDDGIIDDGCDCAVGTERPCWLGPPDSRGVGACRDGVQRCESDGATATWTYCLDQTVPAREVLANGADDDCDGAIDESDGICVPTLQLEEGAACDNGRDDDCDTLSDCDDPGCAGALHCPGGCDPRETLCWGNVDDDCDGAFDCDDSDCMADVSCRTGPCPRGQTPTYTERNLGSRYGASSISAGDGRPIMPMMCDRGRCPEGQVAVILAGRDAICVPPPPECPAGTNPNYVASGTWRCDGPCDLVIHYGSIYGGQTVCAPRPRLSCPSGQVPTFVYETQTWQCRPTCDNGLYDQIRLDGAIVCVPC